MIRPILLGLAAALAAPAFAATPINETRPLDPRGSVEVSNLKGSIEVRTWDRAEVRITGSLGNGVERLVIEGGARSLSVEARYPRNSRNSEPTTLIVDIPRQASLDVDSVAASVNVAGVGGARLEIDSVSGSVVAVGAPGEASIESVSGNLRLNLNSREVDVDSVSGNINLRGRIVGSVDVETVSGNIDVDTRGERVRSVDASSVSGDTSIRTGLASGGGISLESVSGDIRVVLPRDVSARASGSSFSGTLDASGAEIRRKKYGPGASFEHRYGTGDGEITLETFSGDASLSLE
jgi:DUF4097 and DUF4098 domain-containing protein YvlB